MQAIEPRDPRVPPAGTILRRVFDGKAYEVTVCAEGFEYEGGGTSRSRRSRRRSPARAGTGSSSGSKRGESAREESAA